MGLFDQARAAARAFQAARVGELGRDAVNLPRPPSSPPGPPAQPMRREAGPVFDVAPSEKRIERIPLDRVRWLRADVESAKHAANLGDMTRAAQLAQWVKEDLVCGGLMLTRCSVPRLPRQWSGSEEARAWLQGEGDKPGVFDRVMPPSELEEKAVDHLDLGIGVSCFVQPEGSPLPRLVRLDNQNLRYIPGLNRWQYYGYNRLYNVTPGDGVWVFHAQSATDPWRGGLWPGLSNDLVSSVTSTLSRDAFVQRFGLPTILAEAPLGASDDQKGAFWESFVHGIIAVIGMTPGYKASILQAKAEGADVFKDSEARQERRAAIAICGTEGILSGGQGFANSALFVQVKGHLVQRTGQDLCATLNEQAIPQLLYYASRSGKISRKEHELVLAYDTTPPEARKLEAEALSAAAKAVKDLEEAGFAVDKKIFGGRFQVPEIRTEAPTTPPLVEVPANDGGSVEAREEPPEPGYSEQLAEVLTQHARPTCRHGEEQGIKLETCRRCGVRRQDVYEPGQNGAPGAYRIVWKPIAARVA